MKLTSSKWLFITFSLIISFLLPTEKIFSQDTFVYGDALPDAPELAPRGEFKVGVRTLDFVNKGQIDVLKSKGGIDPTYDRPIKVEVWYPANLPEGSKESVIYDEVMGTSNDPKRPLIPFTFAGRASRNVAPLTANGNFPLIIVSHGYVGSRV